MIHGYISLSGLIRFLIVQNFPNSAHPNGHPILGVETNKMSSIEYGIGTQYVWQEGMRKTVLGL